LIRFHPDIPVMTQYLTPEQVLFLHSRLISETGGGQGVRDLGMLLSALGRPQATFDEKELYPDIFTKTAALMDSLVRNHPFLDGNKRTAITSAALFLRINGYRLVVGNDEMVLFTMACAQSQCSLDEIVDWFTRYSVTIH
jgi:death on curing protein